MTILFLACALVGGTILLTQLSLMMLGLGGHGGHFGGGDIGSDFSGDFHGDVGDAFHGDGASFHGDAAGHGDAHGGHADSDAKDLHAHPADHGSTWLFGVISFRTVVAALAFFGASGMAAQSAGASAPTTLLIACASGAAAMYSVYWIMQGLYRLRAEGTVRIQRAIGHPAKVYLSIPGNNAGAGKIQINLQNRTMEYLAMTSGEPLPTGTKVVVVNILTENTVEVQPVEEQERVSNG